MVEAIASIAVLAMVVYVWIVQPAMRFRRGRRSGRRLPDPWVT